MVTQHMETMTEETTQVEAFHALSDSWTLWGHLPHNTDWSVNSYINISNLKTVEETIAVTETLPSILVENCMLFIMRNGIKPTWEDPKNRNGGCFSYRVTNKNVYKVWKELTYVLVGESISKKSSFVSKVTGITISPKKNFCVIKIWMMDCSHQNPFDVIDEIKYLPVQGCIFKKHTPEY
jgi:hypothetical protein